jgi:PKD repeat protein
MSITNADVKAAMTAKGYDTSAGTAWEGQDQGVYDGQFTPDVSYAAGVPIDHVNANYGLAYPSVLPAAISNAVQSGEYSVTIAATPLSGAHPLSVTATATEPASKATSYSWNFGDGTSAQVTTVPTAVHSYAAAGSFTIHMTPTVGGVAKPAVAAPAPVVVS